MIQNQTSLIGREQLSFVPISDQLATRGEGLKWWSVRT